MSDWDSESEVPLWRSYPSKSRSLPSRNQPHDGGGLALLGVAPEYRGRVLVATLEVEWKNPWSKEKYHIVLPMSTLCGVPTVAMLCYVFFQKFRLLIVLHSSCSISQMACETTQKCFTKYHDWRDASVLKNPAQELQPPPLPHLLPSFKSDVATATR